MINGTFPSTRIERPGADVTHSPPPRHLRGLPAAVVLVTEPACCPPATDATAREIMACTHSGGHRRLTDLDDVEAETLLAVVQAGWPPSFHAMPRTVLELGERGYLLEFAYLRYRLAADTQQLTSPVHALVCCVLRGADREPEKILREAAVVHVHLDQEVVALVRHYYTADASPLSSFAPSVDTAYLSEHPEALHAVFQHHLSLSPADRYPLSVGAHAHICRLLGRALHDPQMLQPTF